MRKKILKMKKNQEKKNGLFYKKNTKKKYKIVETHLKS